MKRWVIALLIVLIVFSYGCTTQEVSIEKVPEPTANSQATEEPQTIIESQKPLEKVEEEQVIVSPQPKKKEEFQIINPTLTYEGAYNGPLYATSEQVGSASMDSYFELLDKNGINFFIGMFGISGEPSAKTLISDQGLGEIIAAAQKHPHRIIPFFNPGIGGEEVEQYLGDTWLKWYRTTLAASKQITGNVFIKGFGEVETQEWKVRHNDQNVLKLIEIAQENNLHFMFHPVASKIEDVEDIVERYPRTTFLIHMYREDLAKSMDKLIKIMQEHNNLYFSVDAAHILFVNSLGGDIVYVYDSEDKESSIRRFVSTFDSKEKSMIDDAIRAYKPLVDAVPNKVMWGTEIGPEYAFDPQVFDRAVKISRFVIAGFAKEHQEAIGYQNALRVFGEGVVVDTSIKVLSTNSWPECTNTQISDCDTSCEIPESDTLTSEQERCYQNCLIGKSCREVVKMDVG